MFDQARHDRSSSCVARSMRAIMASGSPRASRIIVPAKPPVARTETPHTIISVKERSIVMPRRSSISALAPRTTNWALSQEVGTGNEWAAAAFLPIPASGGVQRAGGWNVLGAIGRQWRAVRTRNMRAAWTKLEGVAARTQRYNLGTLRIDAQVLPILGYRRYSDIP